MAETRYRPEQNRLLEQASILRDAYCCARPFPHAVIDGLFPDAVLDAILDEFPNPGQFDWIRFENPRERKLGARTVTCLPDPARDFLAQLNATEFVRFIEALTGIEHLVPDPHYFGGGLHQIERGGYLKVHADFNFNPHVRMYRRVNLLVYLNRSWEEAYGGHLQLWNEDMSGCERAVLPVFNRTVIFETSDRSFHGHPDPLTCPQDRTRKSLALYYYTSDPPETADPHCTIFRRRPEEQFEID